MPDNYMIHLHCHTDVSILDGLFGVDKWLDKAKKIGCPALAITDHGSMGNIYQLISKAKNYGIKPIAGIEAYLVNDLSVKKNKERKYHITLLAKNDIGLNNIIKLNNISNIEGFYRKPRIDFRHLIKYQEGIIVLTGCTGGILSRAITTDDNGKINNIAKFFKENFDNVFVEVMFLDIPELIERLTWRLCEVATRHNMKIVVTNDCHYLEKNDYELQTILLKIKSKKKINEKSFKLSTNQLWMKSYEEIKEIYEKSYSNNIPKKSFLEIINNTNDIADMVEQYSFTSDYKFPEFRLEDQKDYQKFKDWIKNVR